MSTDIISTQAKRKGIYRKPRFQISAEETGNDHDICKVRWELKKILDVQYMSLKLLQDSDQNLECFDLYSCLKVAIYLSISKPSWNQMSVRYNQV